MDMGIGRFWALLYGILLTWDTQSLPLAEPILLIDLRYFFTTLTTLGYGDIAPSSGVARDLAVLEAIFGQLYVAILVARILGLHSIKRPHP
ncbi:MAG: two pore domain potassium channel family protein [Desulfobacterium sp.]|nr:two pore domain potassium channel family protein [Desulfobacterium sp.]